MSTPPADWYPDPEQPARLRYWDGAQWTGYLVDPDRPGVVRFEPTPWKTQAAGINVPLSIAVTAAF